MPIRSQFETEAEWFEHLRLWFAGQALQGLLTNPSMISPGQLKASRHHGNLVTLANEIATAMLKAREA